MSKPVKTVAERLAAVGAVDAVGVAVKIAQAPDPLRFAMAASAIEMVAMAQSLLAFEAASHQLLFLFDVLAATKSASSEIADVRQAQVLQAETRTEIGKLTDDIASALEALGYASQPENTNGQEDQGAGS